MRFIHLLCSFDMLDGQFNYIKHLFSLPIALYLFICGCPPPLLLSLFSPPLSLLCLVHVLQAQEGSSRRLFERAPVSKRPTTSQFTLRSQISVSNSLTHTHCEHPVCLLPLVFLFGKTALTSPLIVLFSISLNFFGAQLEIQQLVILFEQNSDQLVIFFFCTLVTESSFWR